MDPGRFIGQYFWALCLAISIINYIVARRRQRAMSALDASQLEEAQTYLRWSAAAMCLPWVIMGVGQISGYTPTIWNYFRPQDHNPFVIAWLGCILLLAVVHAVWVLFMGGARKIREFDLYCAVGARSKRPQPEWVIKLIAVIGPFFIIGWIYLAATKDVPLPR